jgi:hypothetical protein
MEGDGKGELLIKSLFVAGVCAAIAFWAGSEYSFIGFAAFLVGIGAAIVAAFCVLGFVLSGLAQVFDSIGDRRADRRYRIRLEEEAAHRAKLEASRERHRANRAAWLRTARQVVARQPPAWDGANRDAFSWLYARVGKTVTIRTRTEGWRSYQYGERNASPQEDEEPTEWRSSEWVVNLPDDALSPAERADRVDESVVTVCWEIPGAATLPVGTSRVAVDARGIEIRFEPRSWSDTNDYDHGYFGEKFEVTRIEDPR